MNEIIAGLVLNVMIVHVILVLVLTFHNINQINKLKNETQEMQKVVNKLIIIANNTQAEKTNELS